PANAPSHPPPVRLLPTPPGGIADFPPRGTGEECTFIPVPRPRTMPMPIRRLPLLALLVLAVPACSPRDDDGKAPLGAQATSDEDQVPPRAQAALDAGNDEYRAGRYLEALEHYSTAAREAPGSAAP